MIFKKLFRPKHQDPNPKIRIQAIASLSPEENEQKSRLHELAFNDEDYGVNIAALDKLNSFALWSKVAETAKSERLKKKAQVMVENALFGESKLNITEQERMTFVKECKSTPMLEKLINLPWIKSDNPDLLVELLERIGKPNIKRQVLMNSGSEQVQLSLAADIADSATLNKLAKKTQFPSVHQLINTKLEKIEIATSKPIEIEKNSKLVLSQLLALKEKKDLLVVRQEQEKFQTQFQQLQLEFSYLSEPAQQHLNKRYKEISERIDSHIKQLEPEWQNNQLRRELQEDFTNLKLIIEKTINEVSVSLAGDISSITLGQVETFEETLQDATRQLTELVKSSNGELTRQSETLFNQINQCRATLERLPEFQSAVKKANEFLASFTALSLPNDISQIEASQSYLSEQRKSWEELVFPFKTNWPESLGSQWKSTHKRWSKAITELKEQVRQNESRCRSKMKAIERLIEQGKFKAAIGLYAKVESWYSQLPERSQDFLSRNFSKVKDQVENIKDWQQYISRPRKPALLDEAIALTTINATTEDEIKSLSNDIKRLRSEWLNLGVGETEADLALNSAFELAIEKAFEPCRHHYAELEKIRDENLVAKEAVLVELRDLSKQDFESNPRKITDSFATLQKRWRDIGKIDFKLLDEVNEKYHATVNPIKQKVNGFYQQNAQDKQDLVDRAKKLLELEDLSEAVEQAKNLQRKWKEIDHAGQKAERQLWLEFRKLNDAIFNKRQELNDLSKKQLDAKHTEIKETLDSIKTELEASTDLSQLDLLSLSIEEAKVSINDAFPDEGDRNPPGSKHLKALAKLSDLLNDKKRLLEENQRTQYFDDIFEELHKWDQDGLDEKVQSRLPNVWQQCFKQAPTSNEMSRKELTIMMEILADLTSPDKDAEIRKTLQLKLMTSRLQDGENHDVTYLLQEWIKHGPLKSGEKTLLKRTQKAFTASAWRG